MLSVANSKVFCKLGNGTVADLTEVGSAYVHPATKQCSYTYTHPSTKQCSWTPTINLSKTIFSKSGTLTASEAVTTIGTANLTGYTLILIYYSGNTPTRVGPNLRINGSYLFPYISEMNWHYADIGFSYNASGDYICVGLVHGRSCSLTSNSTIDIDGNASDSITVTYSVTIKGVNLDA